MNNKDSVYKKIDLKALGERIKELRGNESQGSFAERFGVSQADISRLERGSVINPAPELLFNICIRFNVNFDWLLTGEGPKKKEFKVFDLIRREGVEGASLYSTSEGPLPEYLIEARLGIPQDTLDEWLAREKRGAVAEPGTPHEPEDPILSSIQAKIKTLYKEGNFDIKSRLVGTVELLFNELRIQKEEEQKPKIEEQKKGA